MKQMIICEEHGLGNCTSCQKPDPMKAEEILKKVKEYLEDNKEASSLDIQSDSKHLLFWIENWEAD